MEPKQLTETGEIKTLVERGSEKRVLFESNSRLESCHDLFAGNFRKF